MAGLFIKLDTNYWNHPKIVAVGYLAGVLYQQMSMYCMDHTTDGHVPDAVLPRFGMPRVRQQVEALAGVGLIERDGEGWLVPGYVERYKTAAEVDELREKRRAAGRQGGRPRKQTEKPNGKQSAFTASNPEYIDTEIEIEGESSSDTSAARPPAPDDDDLPERLWAGAGIARPGPTEGDRRTIARALARGWEPSQLLAKASRAARAEHDPAGYLRSTLADAANADPPTERLAAAPTGAETRDSAWAAVRRLAAAGPTAWTAENGLSYRARMAALQVRGTIKSDTEQAAKWAFFAAWDELGQAEVAS